MLILNVLGGLYLTSDEGQVAGAAAQPRRLAVLALLAVAGERGMARERILDLLWPDTDEERGRHALTQALYSLRRDLGADELFLGQQDLRLNPALITSDHHAFREAVRAGEPARAVAHYRGPFLEGFHLPEADNFSRWADEQRDAAAHDYGRMLDAAARQAREQGDHATAADFLRRRAAQDPFNSKVAHALMECLAASGAVVEALQHARTHERVLKDELGLGQDPDVAALAERLRATPRAATALGTPPAPPAVPVTATAPDGSSASTAPAVSTAARILAGVVLLAVIAFAARAVLGRRAAAPPTTVIAVGGIADYSGKQQGELGLPLADMLAINLARGTGYRVISNARMLDLMHQLRGTGDSTNLVARAARQAGAAQLVDGALYAIAPQRYRLDLRRVDLATGAVLGAYRMEGTDLFALADSGVRGLVPDLGGTAPSGSVTQASTTSIEAYKAYEEGLRRFHDGDMATAERRFREALDRDSTFALAAYYYAVSTTSGSRTETLERFRHAVALARHASDRERLIIQAEWAAQNASPTLRFIVETLMVRYPEEVDGFYFAGMSANLTGDYERGVAPLRRVLQLDSLGFRNPAGGRCRACEAYSGLGYSYGALDSLQKLGALVHEFVSRYPAEAQAWRMLASLHAQEQNADAAFRALAVADSLEPTNPWNRRYLISVHAVLEQYAVAEQLIRAELRAGSPNYRAPAALWDLAVVLRQQGRLREALSYARQYRAAIREAVPRGAAPYTALHEGQVLFEMGRFAAAAALFDSVARGQSHGADASLHAHDQVWAWVHEADARAGLRDTVRLRFLADSMEILGRDAVLIRDRHLYAHVHGLLARVQGRDDDAVRWFREAITSPVLGFTRSNYELAGALMRLGRPAEGIGTLRSATHGGTDGSTLYITRTELEARLAQAFEAAGQRDSARYYYDKVLRHWAAADPEFAPRLDSSRTAMARLGSPVAR